MIRDYPEDSQADPEGLAEENYHDEDEYPKIAKWAKKRAVHPIPDPADFDLDQPDDTPINKEIVSNPPANLRILLKQYEAQGFSIIPVKNNDKLPLVNWKQFQSRKPTNKEIEEWYEQYWSKGANIGIVCGKVSGNLVVLDFDTDTAWKQFLKQRSKNRLEEILNITPVVKTARGHHVYLRCKSEVKKQKLKTGIDIQGEASFVVAPPSEAQSGHKYHFLNPSVTQILEINNLSDVGIDLSNPNYAAQPSIDGKGATSDKVSLIIENIMDGAPQGMRNDACFRMASWYKYKGVSQADALDALITGWAQKCTPPLDKSEVASCVKSAYRYSNEKSSEQTQPQVEAITNVAPPTITAESVLEDELAEGKYQIRTGEELVNTPVPVIKYRIEGLLRARGGRLALVGQYKMAKSMLAHDLALKIAAGKEWLGFPTLKGNVLYVNLEISSEKFQERTQDIQNEYKYGSIGLQSFRETTILDDNLSLDKSIDRIQHILNECANSSFQVNVLILDPRARCIRGSENEEIVIKSFCDNVDKLLSCNEGLSIIIVTHMGKDASKGAIGHSRFSGWLDTEIRIVPKSEADKTKSMYITGRDAERTRNTLKFEYPLHTIVQEEEEARRSKVDLAKEFIIKQLTISTTPEQELKYQARSEGITDYAFHTAIRELKDVHKITTTQTGGKGNRRILELTR